VVFAISFIVTLCLTPIHIWMFKRIGKVGEDRHKAQRPNVPEMGGITIFFGMLISYFALLHYEGPTWMPYVIASLSIIFFVGIIDDIYAIRQRTKLLLLMFSAIPLFFYDGGVLDLTVAEFGVGAFYYIAATVGMSASSNLTNILEGFNGESIGLGAIASGFLLIDAQILGSIDITWILLPVFGSLLAFLLFNKYPARVFPGDTGTLLIGGSIGLSVIIGGHVVIGVIVLMPQIVEFLLKSRKRFSGVSYGATKVDGSGYLSPPPYLSVANCLTSRFRLKEYSLVMVIWALGALSGILSLMVTYVII